MAPGPGTHLAFRLSCIQHAPGRGVTPGRQPAEEGIPKSRPQQRCFARIATGPSGRWELCMGCFAGRAPHGSPGENCWCRWLGRASVRGLLADLWDITGVSAFVRNPKQDRFQKRRMPVGIFDSSPSFASTQFAKDQGRCPPRAP